MSDEVCGTCRCRWCGSEYDGQMIEMVRNERDAEAEKMRREIERLRDAEMEALRDLRASWEELAKQYSEELAKLREAQRWMPVEERLPEEMTPVLVSQRTRHPQIMWLQDGEWQHQWVTMRSVQKAMAEKIERWRPLPEPLEATERKDDE